MSYVERIKDLANRAAELSAVLNTEEATKNALVMPFIAALGYDVFNPLEVIPEYTADVGTKKGEKVDYAIKVDGETVMIWECKGVTEKLEQRHMSQLFRYFSVTKSRIGVLTNGLVYQFFSDLEESNKMDEKPFFQIDLRDLRENRLREIERLTKSSFDLETMLSAASDLKYMREIRRYLEAQFDEPSEEFVRVCFSQANPGVRFSQKRGEKFAQIVSRVLAQLVSDRVGDRLRNALQQEQPLETEAPERMTPDEGDDDDWEYEDDGIETTEEEQEAYMIVRAILRSEVSAERVALRDTKSYCGVLFDDNNRKPICRLHFNRSRKYLGLFDSEKKETKIPIEDLADIYEHADVLRAVVRTYLQRDEARSEGSSADVEAIAPSAV